MEHDERIRETINNAYMDGFHDHSDGNVDYGSGHWIFHEVDGGYYALQTNSQGNQWLYTYPSKGLWDQAREAVENEYNELEEPEVD